MPSYNPMREQTNTENETHHGVTTEVLEVRWRRAWQTSTMQFSPYVCRFWTAEFKPDHPSRDHLRGTNRPKSFKLSPPVKCRLSTGRRYQQTQSPTLRSLSAIVRHTYIPEEAQGVTFTEVLEVRGTWENVLVGGK